MALNSGVIPLRKRRKRTNLDATQRSALDQFFKVNPRPDHDKMAQIAEMLELDRDVSLHLLSIFSFFELNNW